MFNYPCDVYTFVQTHHRVLWTNLNSIQYNNQRVKNTGCIWIDLDQCKEFEGNISNDSFFKNLKSLEQLINKSKI